MRSSGIESKKATSRRHLQHCLQSCKETQSWKGLTSTCITIQSAGKTWITQWRTDHLHNQNISNSQNFGRRVLHPWCPVELYHCLHLQYVYLLTVFFFPSCSLPIFFSADYHHLLISWIIWNLWQGCVSRQLCAPESMSIRIASNNTLKSPNFHPSSRFCNCANTLCHPSRQ